MPDIAASFQEAVVDMLINPTINAAVAHNVNRIVLAGGVAANSRLREKINERAATEEFASLLSFCEILHRQCRDDCAHRTSLDSIEAAGTTSP